MYYILYIATAVITGLFGLALIVNPENFIGSYIFKQYLWTNFDDSLLSNTYRYIITYLLFNLALALISTACVYVYLVYDNFLFLGISNIIIWSIYFILDNIIRWKWDLYNRTYSIISGTTILLILLGWIYFTFLA